MGRKKSRVVAITYSERDRFLRSIGYLSYREYLASLLWQSIRSTASKFLGKVCRLCGAVATCVHHMYYTESILLGRSYKGLTPLCDSCHRNVEFYSDGSKRTAHEAEMNLRSKLRAKGQASSSNTQTAKHPVPTKTQSKRAKARARRLARLIREQAQERKQQMERRSIWIKETRGRRR